MGHALSISHENPLNEVGLMRKPCHIIWAVQLITLLPPSGSAAKARALKEAFSSL
jgi:hypothetical protein